MLSLDVDVVSVQRKKGKIDDVTIVRKAEIQHIPAFKPY